MVSQTYVGKDSRWSQDSRCRSPCRLSKYNLLQFSESKAFGSSSIRPCSAAKLEECHKDLRLGPGARSDCDTFLQGPAVQIRNFSFCLQSGPRFRCVHRTNSLVRAQYRPPSLL